MENESIFSFDPTVRPGFEDLAIQEACAAARAIKSGDHIVKFLIVAKGLEALADRAQQMSNSSNRKGKRYNEALARQKSAYPELSEKFEGVQFTAAVWILKNWQISKPYITALPPERLFALNTHSLRTMIMRDVKASMPGAEEKPKKPGLREEVAALQEENDKLRESIRKAEISSERAPVQSYTVWKDDADHIVREIMVEMSDHLDIDHLHKQANAIIREMQQFLRDHPKPKKAKSRNAAAHDHQ